jgi:copper transport protein
VSRARRTACASVFLVCLLAASAAPAFGHARLLGSTPAAGERGVPERARAVVLHFTEPVAIVNRSDVSVVNGRGRRVDTGSPTAAGTQVVIPLHEPLLPDSYSVRLRVLSEDSHAESSAFVFAVGKAALGPPILAGSGGLSESSPAAVAARLLELIALGALLGLLAFRALVWGPVMTTARGLRGGERTRALTGAQRSFWRAFWTLAVLAGAAETVVLAAKSAVVDHTGLVSAALHPAPAYRLVSASRFGDLLGWRSAALIALAAVAFLAWSTEPLDAPAAGRRGPLAAMAALALAALVLLADQGHASQAPLAPLSVAADATHLAAVAIWLGGLLCLAAVLLRAPAALPTAGRTLASATLARFSRIAVWSVVVIAVTGLARAAGELSTPEQLLTTGYGNDLLLKTALLAPVLLIARRSRRFTAALADGWTPTAARLRTVARDVQLELVIAVGIVIIAAALVAQLPGRT